MTRFEGRTAVVTGAGGQIGGAAARRLAGEGARVLVVDRDAAAVERVAGEIGDAARGCVADVTDPEAVARYAAEGAALGDGRIDAFFNNAGIEGPVAPIDAYPLEAWDRVFAVNVRAVFLGLQAVLGHMGEGGAVVNTASVAGVVGAPGIAGYVAAKHAVVGLTKTAAVDMAPRRIRVNAVCPGPIAGRMMASLEEGWGGQPVRDALLTRIPAGRYGEPEEVAAFVAYLLSPDASFCTGTAYVTDGGQMAS